MRWVEHLHHSRKDVLLQVSSALQRGLLRFALDERLPSPVYSVGCGAITPLFDRIVQNTLRMILEPIWESDFSIHSYGFRPNRSTYDAISAIYLQLIGSKWTYQWIIEGEIASYFDTIPHQKLIKVVKKRVADKDIHEGLWRFLRAGVMYRGQFTETLTGTPQGGIVSPLLANIYLDQLDKYMETISLNLTYEQRRSRRKKGLGNFLYVRYADDCV